MAATMDLHLIAFSFPRDATGTQVSDMAPTTGSALPPDARAVGSRTVSKAVPIPMTPSAASSAKSVAISRAPGAHRGPAPTLDRHHDQHTSRLGSSPTPVTFRLTAYSDAVIDACAKAMATHRCVVHASPSSSAGLSLGVSNSAGGSGCNNNNNNCSSNSSNSSSSSSHGAAAGSVSVSNSGDMDRPAQGPSPRMPLHASPASTHLPSTSLALSMDSAEPATNTSGSSFRQPSAEPFMEPELPRFSASLCGTQAQVNDARSLLMQTLPFTWRLDMLLEASEILQYGRDALWPDVRTCFDQIMQDSRTRLCVQPSADASLTTDAPTCTTRRHMQRPVILTITGGLESIEYARVQVLVMLDEMSGLHTDTIDLDNSKFLHVNAGRKRSAIQALERESCANVYIPTPFFGVLQSHVPPKVQECRHTVFVTGPPPAIARARELVLSLTKRNRNTVSRQVSLMPRKLDWLLLERQEALRELMLDNSTFLDLPLIGSQTGQVCVHGSSRVDVERSIRMLMQIVAPCYVATLCLMPSVLDTLGLSSKADARPLATLLSSASAASGAEVGFRNSCVDLYGTDSEVRSAMRFLLRQPAIKHCISEVRFQLELATDHREFISGKKNGKINKIMEGCGVRIRFEPFNDYNFLIEVLGREPDAALQGLSQLQEELPAEMSFFVPEAYHKRIIGVGGKNIQRIMKKFGVYVKFSNAEEFAALGGYIDNDDNVIARTPSKNAPNLENLKNSVMELVGPKDKDFVTEAVPVPRKFHRLLVGEKGQVLTDIEHRTRCSIRLARRESGLNTVFVVGPESQTVTAVQMLLQQVPLEAEIPVSNSHEFASMIDSPEYHTLVNHLQNNMATTLHLSQRKNASAENVFVLRVSHADAEMLPLAKKALDDLSAKYHVLLHTSVSPPPAPPLTSAAPAAEEELYNLLPPFSTSHLSPSKADISADSASMPSSTLYENVSVPPSASNKDLKALFEHSSLSSSMPFDGSAGNVNTPLVSPFYTPGYADNAALSAQVWGAPIPSLQDMGGHASKPNVFGAFSSTPIPFPFSPPTDSARAKADMARAGPAAPFSSPGQLLRHDGMSGLVNSRDVGAFGSHPLARPSMSMLNADMGNDIDGFHPLSDPTPRSTLSMMGPPGSTPGPRGPGSHMPRSSVSHGTASDTMDEVSRVLAQIAFDKQ